MTPKFMKFENDTEREKYAIVDSEGILLPIYYFKYKKKIYPVYDDDYGQQEMIYLDGKFVGGGCFTTYPYSVENFVFMIDHHKKGKKKNEKVN